MPYTPLSHTWLADTVADSCRPSRRCRADGYAMTSTHVTTPGTGRPAVSSFEVLEGGLRICGSKIQGGESVLQRDPEIHIESNLTGPGSRWSKWARQGDGSSKAVQRPIGVVGALHSRNKEGREHQRSGPFDCDDSSTRVAEYTFIGPTAEPAGWIHKLQLVSTTSRHRACKDSRIWVELHSKQ